MTNKCIDCKHVVLEKGYEEYAKCSHPKCKIEDPVTGISKDNFCGVARSFDNFCDKEGKYFEPKSS